MSPQDIVDISEYAVAHRKRRVRRELRLLVPILCLLVMIGAIIGIAAWRYLQAGRSAALDGDVPNAEKWLNRAVRLSERSGEPVIAQEARRYLEQVAKKPPEDAGTCLSRP